MFRSLPHGQVVYHAGFAYGIDATGPDGINLAGLTPTNQLRVIDFKGQKVQSSTDARV